MAPSDSSGSLDSIIQQITTSNNIRTLDQTLRNSLPKEARETILASMLPGGQDPLAILDPRVNTLGFLYILSARLNVAAAQSPAPHLIHTFCRTFDRDQAYIAPNRVTLLAKGIMHLAEESRNPRWAIEPLYDLLTRYTPNPSYLTPIHPLFLLACAQTHSYTAALPLLATPITSIDTTLSPDLSYTDNLVYHHVGGMIFAALKQWEQAEEYFEICVTSPGHVPAALQLEALKKLVLVQLISKGKTSALPKYTNPQLSRLLKNTPYNSFINAYPQSPEQLRSILDKEQAYFSNEKNIGLMLQAIARAPRWSIKKLTETYVTLSISEIAKSVKLEKHDEVRALILDMVETSDINAKISSDGTVTFSDTPPASAGLSKADVDRLVKDAQEQVALLAKLDLELGKNRDYLTKALKAKDDPWAAPGAEEDLFGMGMPTLGGGSWTEEAGYA
ncbi:hypothetical protein EYR40_002674 [Pleurotus pulmonarius]|nr:hypothetical protein EYR40_002674 [Pleurotus pulmonarius]